MQAQLTLSETLSWIAFRRHDHLFRNPDELRQAMNEHPERVRCGRPARDLLKALREGLLPASGLRWDGVREQMTGIDWGTVTEADIWQHAEADYRRRLNVN